MSGRALIAVGCDAYDYMRVLNSAEADAQKIFEALMRPQVGEYDFDRSRILLSPTLADLHEQIREILFTGERLDTFTFFFAGHGGVKSGSFYMCLKDSKADSLSASGFSLSNMFLNISESAPIQSNIIIDACESGGLISDLSVLLKSDLIGDAGTPGITLVATSAKDQYSGETIDGGLGTTAILDCIEGREFIQDTTAALDLVEIGRHISSSLKTVDDQTPVVWGLNLYGPPQFCKNPFFSAIPVPSLRNVLHVWPPTSDASIRDHYDRLWKTYASVDSEWDARSFANTITQILEPLRNTPAALAGLFDRLSAAFLERASLSKEAYRAAEVGAALAGCLLPYADDPLIARHTTALHQTIGEAINSASSILVDTLSKDRYALVGNRAGLSDLFYLPERIAKVLGWAGLAGLIFPAGSAGQTRADRLFKRLLRFLLEHYELSIVTMSDAQAPCWAIALARAAAVRARRDGERLTGLLYNSLTRCGGNIAKLDIVPDEAFTYLLMRDSGKFDIEPDLIARPNLTATVLLRAADLFGLEEVFDYDLWRLDGTALGAYFNDDLSQFAEEHMQGGGNVVWQIGHDVFTVSDLRKTWSKPAVDAPVLTVGAAMAALLYPDRVPWFVLTPRRSRRSREVNGHARRAAA